MDPGPNSNLLCTCTQNTKEEDGPMREAPARLRYGLYTSTDLFTRNQGILICSLLPDAKTVHVGMSTMLTYVLKGNGLGLLKSQKVLR